MPRTWWFAALSLVVIVGGAAGCAQERAPINRVQANALDKSFFVGPDLASTADDPEFYKRGTVVDVVYGAGQDGLFTSSYAEPVSRIRWEITEDTLNARLSYERISGTDDKGNAYSGASPKATNDGQIVASYKIESHFDIKHDYNPQTGEQLNIIVENTTDRPWYERQYFRIDWSKNLVTDVYDYDTTSLLSAIGGVQYAPFAYTVLDPASPDAPHFEADAGYFDVTNKVYATPQQIDLGNFGFSGSVPACLLPAAYVSGGTAPWGDCNATELTIRESFRKIVDTDYEPESFDGVRFATLGAFNLDARRTYARNYGLLDQEWYRFIARYNVWDRSHFYTDPVKMTGSIACSTQNTTAVATGDPTSDPNRDTDGDGTADECQGVSAYFDQQAQAAGTGQSDPAGHGARCDIFTQKCTLPYRKRQAHTITWYIAGDTSLFEPTDWATQEWDLAMKSAVQTARLTECRKTGGTGCDDAFPMWTGQQDDIDEAARISRDVNACRRAQGWTAQACTDLARNEAAAVATERGHGGDPGTLAIGEVVAMPPVIVLCHNPVIAGDHPACGAAGLAVRTGDIRYNTVLNIQSPQVPMFWGIMVDADDPLTGEKVAGSMNIWTATTDLAAQQLVDLVRYINGEISTADITNGTYVQNWAAAAKLAGAGGLPTLSRADVNKRLSGATSLDANAFARLTAAAPPPEIQAALDAGKAQILDAQTRNDVQSPGQTKVQATLALARGTDLENQLMNGPILQLAGAPDAVTLQGSLADRVSPLALNNPLLRTRIHQMRDNALAARGACIVDEAPEPSSMTGLATILAKKFPPVDGETPLDTQNRYDRMFSYIQRRYHYSVLAHEMGHSIGLRHNFVSSSAAMFYRPQYWQLRTKNGQIEVECADAVDDGSTCVGPRYFDPVTDEEQSQLIWMWMQSTVMEYPGDTSQDLLGLGVTDFAAARFFYGDNVSVYTNPDYKAATTIGTGVSLATDTFGGLLGIRYGLRATTGGGSGMTEFHYSQLQTNLKLINDCHAVTPAPPADWNAAADGVWDPVLDGHVVAIDGQFTKCRQQPVDYVPYTQLRLPTPTELNAGFYNGGPSVDPATSRLRVPYGFASDNWADLGNVSVFRHDNGGDPYEQVQFLITTQENRHIFDNFRRSRSTFSLLTASQRSFERYNMKLQGIAEGMGFFASIYNDIGTNQGYSFDTLWPYVVQNQAHDNVIAATVAFDHFTRELSRPEPGPHYRRNGAFQDPVLRSATDPDDFGPTGTALGQTQLVIPNGATGFLKDVGFGGHPLENALSTTNGDFNVEYFENAGSYYDKVNTAILLALSEDRFISQARRDFYDARFRSVGMADVLPDGFRRVIANALTNDRSILAPRLAAGPDGLPLLDTGASTATDPFAKRYPIQPLGWTSFWPAGGPEVCFATQGRDACTNYAGDGSFSPNVPANTAMVDPQVGWEVQKFLMAWTVALIKANDKTNWTDMMRIWKLGANTTPDYAQRIEWQDPISGDTYYARTFDTECLFGDGTSSCAGGQVVQKGIAARVLEYANMLTANGYKLDTVNYPATATSPAGFNAYGRAMVVRHPSGLPVVKQDPAIRDVTPDGQLVPTADCDQNVTPTCTPLTTDQNHWAHDLVSYKSVPDYLWQAELVYGWFGAPGQLGVF
jgi:hypothetical protein